MPWSKHKFDFATRAIHAGQAPDSATGAVVTPLYLSSTFEHASPGEFKGFDYSRSGNPTRAAFEACIANLEGARHGFATASGSVATTTILSLLESGDHVLACDDMYGGTRRLFDQVLRPKGIEFTYTDLTDAGVLADQMQKNTRLVWIETPSNPLMKLVDIAAVSEIARKRGALLAVDNTFMSPYFQRPLELGAHIVMHSTTKYINGHSDLIGGAIITNDEELAQRIDFLANAVGGIQSAFDAYLCLRSVKTLSLRMRAHAENARYLAEFLEHHDKVERVLYPGLASHPQHALACSQMSGFGGMISIYLKGGMPEVNAFLKKLEVFTLAESLGGVESLIEHPAIMTHASLTPQVQQALGITDNLLRLSIGVESPEDLKHDLTQALE